MRTLTCVLMFLSAGAVLAADDLPFPQHYLQEQEFFEGHWIGEGTIGDDPARIEFQARWAPGKHALVIHGTTRLGDKNAEPIHWSLLSGCEGETMVDCSFSSDGETSITRWTTKTPTQQEGADTRCVDGEHCTVECHAVKDGNDKWTYTSKTTDGKPIEMVYTRADDVAAGKDDTLWKEHCSRLAGTWEGTGMLGQDLEEFGLKKGDAFTYVMDLQPEMDGRALTGEGQFSVASRDKGFEVRLLSGWDPGTAKIRVLAMWSGGLVEELVYSRRRGDAFLGTYTAKFPGREPTSQRIRSKFTDDDTRVIEFLDGPRKGEALSTWKRKK